MLETFEKYESTSKISFFKSDLESVNKMFSFPETIKITSKVNKTTVKIEKVLNVNLTLKKEGQFRKSKPILFKLHEKCMKNINSFNDLKRDERINEINESKSYNNYDNHNQLNQINKKLKFSSCKNFNFSPQNIFVQKSSETNKSEINSRDRFNINIRKTEE